MDLIKTRLDYSPELIFIVDISGTTESVTEVRLSIFDQTKISYIGRYADGKAFFKLNDPQKYFKLGIFKYDLEVFIGNQYFVPLSGQIEFTEPVKVTAERGDIATSPVTFQAGLIMAKSEINKALAVRLKNVASSLGLPISDVPTKEELYSLLRKAESRKATKKIAHFIKLDEDQ